MTQRPTAERAQDVASDGEPLRDLVPSRRDDVPYVVPDRQRLRRAAVVREASGDVLRRSVQQITLGGVASGSRRGLPSVVVPSIVLESRRKGPTVVVTANIHGDELTGVAVVQALDTWVRTHGFAGKLVLYPSCNPAGLGAGSRHVPTDDQDLNRLFPGNPRGSFSARLAAVLWRDLSLHDPDAVLDLHADAPLAMPYVIVDRPIDLAGSARDVLAERLLALAEATGLTTLREYHDAVYRQFGLDRSLAGAVVNRLRVPAITIEAGPRRTLDEEAVQVAFVAALAALDSLGMVDVVRVKHPTCRPGDWRRSGSPRSAQAGLVEHLVAPGDRVVQGQPLATLRALTGERVDTVRAHADAVVIALNESGWLAAGASVATLGVADEGRL